MAEIISFDKKLRDVRDHEETASRERKIEALRRHFQCSRCSLKCAKCGVSLESDKIQADHPLAAPYPFCAYCHEEYTEFRERSDGKRTQPKYYWHNDLWMRSWENWLGHQKAMEEYRESKEFLKLLGEVEGFFCS